jgi:hypothetical protein
MTSLAQIRTGETGRQYMLSLLTPAEGLAKKIAAAVAQEGECFALLPQDSAPDRTARYEAGGLEFEQRPSDWLRQRIGKYAAQGRQGVFLVQDLWCTPADHAGSRLDTNYFTEENQIYFWGAFDCTHSPDVGLLLEQSMITYGSAAFLVDSFDLRARLEAGRTDLAEVPVSEVYTPAYDDESFVMWIRDARAI